LHYTSWLFAGEFLGSQGIFFVAGWHAQRLCDGRGSFTSTSTHYRTPTFISDHASRRVRHESPI